MYGSGGTLKSFFEKPTSSAIFGKIYVQGAGKGQYENIKLGINMYLQVITKLSQKNQFGHFSLYIVHVLQWGRV